MKRFDIKFEFPTIYEGYWDGEVAYAFGKSQTEETVVKTINHECLHYAIQKACCSHATEGFDTIRDKVMKRSKYLYKELY